MFSSIGGSLGAIAFASMIGGGRSLALTAGMVALTFAVAVTTSVKRSRSTRSRRLATHAQYTEHLADIEQRLAESEVAQRRRETVAHPPPHTMQQVVEDQRRVWERLPHHPDFATLRVGYGSAVPDLVPVLATGGHRDAAPGPLESARAIERRWQTVSRVPIAVDLAGIRCLAIVGEPSGTSDIVRSIVCRLAVFRSPTDLAITLNTEGASDRWDWVKWLPHTRSRGDERWWSTSADEMTEHLSSIVEHGRERHDGSPEPRIERIMLVDHYRPGTRRARVVDAALHAHGHAPTLVIVQVDRPEETPMSADATLTVGDHDATFRRLDGSGPEIRGFAPDGIDRDTAERIARMLAPFRTDGRATRDPTAEPASLAGLIGDRSIRLGESGPLRTPIGLEPSGEPVWLDLREAAAGGMGPHGMLIGATGSGKSELLRTVVTGLASTANPTQLNFVFIDFKGGATFREFDRLPHTAGIVTNLGASSHLVDRMRRSLVAELTRRQTILDAVGADRVDRYRELRRADAHLEPLPNLVVVVDEFGELLTAHPELDDMFVSIGRTGRSLGIHLLVSGQRIDEGRMRRLDGHLRYRICLRTFTPEESIAVIGSRSSFDLPAEPGHGHLSVDASMTRFRGALIDGHGQTAIPSLPLRWLRHCRELRRGTRPRREADGAHRHSVDRRRGHGRPSRQKNLGRPAARSIDAHRSGNRRSTASGDRPHRYPGHPATHCRRRRLHRGIGPSGDRGATTERGVVAHRETDLLACGRPLPRRVGHPRDRPRRRGSPTARTVAPRRVDLRSGRLRRHRRPLGGGCSPDRSLSVDVPACPGRDDVRLHRRMGLRRSHPGHRSGPTRVRHRLPGVARRHPPRARSAAMVGSGVCAPRERSRVDSS